MSTQQDLVALGLFLGVVVLAAAIARYTVVRSRREAAARLAAQENARREWADGRAARLRREQAEQRLSAQRNARRWPLPDQRRPHPALRGEEFKGGADGR